MYENIEEAKGYSKTETKKAFLDHSPKELFKQRAPWILTLILIGGLTQMVILGFRMIWKGQGIPLGPEGDADYTIIPILAFTTAIEVGGSITDTAGNTGSQSSTMLIRAIAVNEVNETNYKKALKLEMKTSLLLASASAIVGMARMYIVWGIMGMLNGLNAQEWGWYSLIAALAALTYFLSIVTGNFIAAILPIMADKYKWDGAIFSGPLQTTLIDIIGIAIYLGITSAVFIPLVNTGVL